MRFGPSQVMRGMIVRGEINKSHFHVLHEKSDICTLEMGGYIDTS